MPAGLRFVKIQLPPENMDADGTLMFPTWPRCMRSATTAFDAYKTRLNKDIVMWCNVLIDVTFRLWVIWLRVILNLWCYDVSKFFVKMIDSLASQTLSFVIESYLLQETWINYTQVILQLQNPGTIPNFVCRAKL